MQLQIEIRESVEKILELTVEQYETLSKLSLELKSDREFWRVRAAASGDFDSEEIASQSRAIHIQRLAGSQYKVQVHNAVGALALPGLLILVEPKIPTRHFGHIASFSDHFPARSSQFATNLATGDMFHNIVANWFLNSVENLLRFGIQSDYVEVSGDTDFVRGKVDWVRSQGNLLSGRLQIEARFEEFSTNNFYNRVIKAASKALLNAPLMDPHLRARARRALSSLMEVGSLQLSDITTALDIVPSTSRPAYLFALQILRGIGRTLQKGRETSRSFLLPTPMIIESGIRNMLVEGLAPVGVSKAGRVLDSEKRITVNPDLVVTNPILVGDVKYRWAKEFWQRSDLAQAVLFAAAYKSRTGVVINFSHPDGQVMPSVGVGEHRIYNIAWVASQEVDPIDSQTHIVREFAALVAKAELNGNVVIGSSERLF